MAHGGGTAYLMVMALPPIASPLNLIKDIRAFYATRARYEIVFAGIAVTITLTLMGLFYFDPGVPKQYRPPHVVYVKQWNKGRTPAEIKAQQAIDAPAERALRKEEADWDAKQRRDAIKLKEALGF